MKVSTPVARAGFAFWSVALVLALGVGLVTASTDVRIVVLDVVLVAAWLALRSLSVGATLTDWEIVARGWFRTYRVPLTEVESITVVPYAGLLGGRDVERSFRMPRIGMRGGGAISVESLMGTPERVADVVDVLNRGRLTA